MKRFLLGLVIGFLLGGGTFTAVSMAGAAQRLGVFQQWFNASVTPMVAQWGEVMASTQGAEAVETTRRFVDDVCRRVTDGVTSAPSAADQ